MQERGLKLRWPAELVDHLATTGFDPDLGARPLQRQIEREVIAPLARWLLEHPDHTGEVAWSSLSVQKQIS